MDDRSLANILVRNGFVDKQYVQEALKEQKHTGHSFLQFLLQKGYLSQDNYRKAIALARQSMNSPLRQKVSLPGQFRAGEKFANYTIYSKVGEGAGGIVYKVMDSQKKVLALKILPTQNQGDLTTKLKRFEREIKTTTALDHPNIIKIYDWGTRKNCLYFTMDFVDGEDFGKLTKENTVPLNRFLEIIEKTARALDYIHSKGIIHRDIKPANILLTRENEPKIADLGLVKILDITSTNITKTGTVLGSPYYMSPEQVLGIKKVDRRTDIYSMGIILYEFIMHRLPFDTLNIKGLFHAMAFTPPPIPSSVIPDVIPDVEKICLKAIDKNPDKRYQTAKEMADDIRRYLEGKPVLAKPVKIASNTITKYIPYTLLSYNKSVFLIVIFIIMLFLCLFVVYLMITLLQEPEQANTDRSPSKNSSAKSTFLA